MRTQKAREKDLLLQKLSEFIEEFSEMDDEVLYNMSVEIIKDLEMQTEYELINILETKLEALKSIIDNRLYIANDTYSDEGFMPYPEYIDNNFNEKIMKKKEFNMNKNLKYDEDVPLDVHSKKECSGFRLSNNQKFIKTFLSPSTPYNGILLFYGTGVGKTCSAISIAEQYMDELTKYNKKVIILLNPSIKQNFMKNIFDINKVKQGNTKNQCTGDSYLKKIGKYKSIEDLEAKITKVINSKYSFYGYQEFVNLVEKKEREFIRGVRKDMQKHYVKRKLKELFSNTVFIIDEAHNIKEGGNTKKIKTLPPILEQIIRLSENIKLILLTATPMFDNATEIVWLLNLLLMNDRKTKLKTSDLFDRRGTLTEEGLRLLRYKSRGYISYLRGENPIKFPLRLYPDINNHPQIIKVHNFPNTNIHGIKIDEDDRIKTLQIIGCPMKNVQLESFNQMTIKEVDEMDVKSVSTFGAFDLNGMLLSNIVFPTPPEYSGKIPIGKDGFNISFKKNKGYTFNDNIPEDFLDIKNIEKYSSKIKSILQNIKSSNGIIFIYSQFIWGGIVPLALALEYNGFTKYSPNKSNVNLLHGGPKTDYFSDSPSYTIISGEKSISPVNAYKDYLSIENRNVNGDIVKVIIGSETAAEGLDFKYIREVHILDPWHHLNKIEQIIGRGIRYCSHIDLPLELRNVTVYLYASTLSDTPKNDNETIDLKMYRNAEFKSRQMALVEYELKTNAVDCNLNININKFIGPYWEKRNKIITSQGNEKMVSINDNDNTKKCNYNICDFKCNPDVDIKAEDLNYDTFNPKIVNDHINEVITLIVNLYKHDLVYDLEDIKTKLDKYSIDNILILGALNKMIEDKQIFKDMYDRDGYLVYDGGFYIFNLVQYKNITTSINNLRRPITLKTKKINITDYLNSMNNIKLIETESDDENIALIMKKIDSIELELTNHISLAPDKKFSDVDKADLVTNLKKVPEIYLDRLETYQKNILLKYLITSDGLSGKERIIRQNLYKNILLYKDVYFGNSKYTNNNNIWGYKVGNNGRDKPNYYYFKDGTHFIPANGLQLAEINKTIKKKEMDLSIILGYMEEKLPDKTILFKVRDKTGQGKKKKTFIKTGSVCGNDGMKKEKIIDFLTKILGKNKYLGRSKATLPGKQLLCLEVEIYLRLFDKQKKDSKRWYYNIEESLEYNINQKK